MLDRHLLFNGTGKGSVDGGGGVSGGVRVWRRGGGDFLRNLSNCRACEAVLAKRQLSVQLTEVAFTGRYHF